MGVAEGLTEKVTTDRSVSFCFYSCGKIPPPVIMVQNVSFRYNEDTPYIYKNLEFGMDLDTRLALVGPNGAGKSTLIKLIYGTEVPTEGMVRRHNHLKLGLYHQHLHELLEMDLSPLDYMLKKFPEFKERDEMRKVIGRYGIIGKAQTAPIKQLSDGQKCRVVFAWLSWQMPHMLLFDEPTNHLDLEACVWLEEELKTYPTILLIVSHSQDFLNGVCTSIMHMDLRKLKIYGGNYDQFMKTRGEQVEAQMKQYNWEQDQIAHMKEYIARFGHGSAKLARQAQSKEKTLAKMVADGLTQKVVADRSVSFCFYDCGKIPPPVIMVQNVSFRYNDETPLIYKNLEFGMDLADAIKGYEGGVILVSHDFRLIDQVAKDIWICENQKVTEWDGDILAYKNHLKAKVMKAANKDAKSKGLDKGVRGAW